jgi:hypothetical protein
VFDGSSSRRRRSRSPVQWRAPPTLVTGGAPRRSPPRSAAGRRSGARPETRRSSAYSVSSRALR